MQGISKLIKMAKKLKDGRREDNHSTIEKKYRDEKRATIKEDARKPKNVSKPKAKTTKKPTMKDVAGRTDKQRFRERMEMGLPDNARQKRLSKIPGKKQIRKKKD